MDQVARLELIEERLAVGKEEVETGRVRVSLRTEEREERVNATLRDTAAEIERVPIGRFVDEAPEVRTEDGVLIVPVLEEVVVTRIKLVEEIRIRRVESVRETTDTVILRREVAEVENAEPR